MKYGVGENSSLTKIPTNSNAAYFSKDNEEMLITFFGNNFNTEIWYTHNLARHYILSGGHTDVVTCAAFSNNNDFTITGSRDFQAIVWEREDKKYVLKGHDKEINQVFLNDKIDKAITVSTDGTLKIWLLKTNDKLYGMKEFRDSVRYNKGTNKYEVKISEYDWRDIGVTPEEIIKNMAKEFSTFKLSSQ